MLYLVYTEIEAVYLNVIHGYSAPLVDEFPNKYKKPKIAFMRFTEERMIINHNIPALNSHYNLAVNGLAQEKAIEKLSSGMRINRAADDAAGLAVSEKMRAQVRGLDMANRNAQDAISFIQTTDGYLQEMTNVVQRLRELAIQAANGIYTAEDRMYIQAEVNQLVDELDRTASQAQFNTHYMLTGRFSPEDNAASIPTASMWIHVGANMDERERVYINTMTAAALGVKDQGTGEVISVSTQTQANQAIAVYDSAIERLSSQRADLGAYQNRMESVVRQLSISSENLQAAESRIRDLDFAKGSTDFTIKTILVQSATAMLAQANVQPQLALRLIQ